MRKQRYNAANGVYGHLQRTRGHPGSSHLLFADDIIVFANGEIRDLGNIYNYLLQRYQDAAVQFMNKHKSELLIGGITLARRSVITQELDGLEGTLPEDYLGVTLLGGKVTRLGFRSVYFD
ncbi:hypothetical protein IFM89_010901 [Coptis chinensis]|uniref:Reverse transcriptase domain-containing protein n=1 Tax=Coptis chinensis TaxID=261450 RepID=A0A835ILX5_9MAGN|nr:hypothetical protein IFM89_010901 [Coptis chinensis]